MNNLTNNSYDIAIAGAGPAGSSLAIRLANAGLSVLLVEQKKFPRDKLCGEFISPECLTHFDELGILPELTNAGGTDLSETIFFSRSGKGLSIKSEWFGNIGSTALGLSRAEMDLQLLEKAKRSGVEVRDETNVSGLISENNVVSGIKLKDKNGTESAVHARLTIDATGRTRSLARRLDNQTTNRTPADFIAFKTHLKNASVTPGACEIYVYSGGYGGCNQVEDDLYNLCFIASAKDTKRLGSDAERVMREVVFTNKRAAVSMKDAMVSKPWLAVPIERFGRGELVPANGLISVGDAAAFIDPFTGSGILLGLESGKIASSAITRCFTKGYDFNSLASEYRREYSATFDRRLQVCLMLRHAAFAPYLAEATISLLSFNENIRRRLAKATRFSAGSAA